MKLKNTALGLTMLTIGTANVNCATTNTTYPQINHEKESCDYKLQELVIGYFKATTTAAISRCDEALKIEQKIDELSFDYFEIESCDQYRSKERKELLLITILQLKHALKTYCRK